MMICSENMALKVLRKLKDEDAEDSLGH